MCLIARQKIDKTVDKLSDIRHEVVLTTTVPILVFKEVEKTTSGLYAPPYRESYRYHRGKVNVPKGNKELISSYPWYPSVWGKPSRKKMEVFIYGGFLHAYTAKRKTCEEMVIPKGTEIVFGTGGEIAAKALYFPKDKNDPILKKARTLYQLKEAGYDLY